MKWLLSLLHIPRKDKISDNCISNILHKAHGQCENPIIGDFEAHERICTCLSCEKLSKKELRILRIAAILPLI